MLLHLAYNSRYIEHEIIPRARGSMINHIAIKELKKMDRSEIHFVALKRNYKHLPRVLILQKKKILRKLSP
jgi:hypothetical protein